MCGEVDSEIWQLLMSFSEGEVNVKRAHKSEPASLEKLLSQKEGKHIEVNVIFYTSFPLRYFQFINIFDGEGKADARKQRN